jgi:hypothetical protein
MHILHYAIFLAGLFCFIYVVFKMFQNGSTVLGIVCLVTACCAIGPIIAFVVGWMRSSQWDIKGLMMIWTVAVIANIVLHFVSPSPFVEQLQQQVQQFQAK